MLRRVFNLLKSVLPVFGARFSLAQGHRGAVDRHGCHEESHSVRQFRRLVLRSIFFDSEGQGVLALIIGCSVTACTVCLCCVPICWAQCASPEMRHALGQEWSKFVRCVGPVCCCCCHCCNNCCGYFCETYCCKKGKRNSDTPTEAYVPRTDPYAIPEMPEMVEMGRAVEMKATAI